jgi:AraC-like DNA-binding protein
MARPAVASGRSLRIPFWRMSEGFDVVSKSLPFFVGARTLTNLPVGFGEGRYQPHIHCGLEIGAVVSGRARVYFDGEIVPCKANDVFCIECMVPHCISTYPNDSFDFLYVHLSTEAMASLLPLHAGMELLHMFRPVSPALPRIVRDHGVAVKALLRAHDHFHGKEHYSRARAWTEVAAAIVELAARAFPRGIPATGAMGGSHSEKIIDILGFIHDNFRGPLSIKRLAGRACLSPSRLAHIFAQSVGQSPIEYRNKLRVDFCVERILSSRDKIEKIAIESGFENLANFYRQFRKHTGKSPAQVRAAE